MRYLGDTAVERVELLRNGDWYVPALLVYDYRYRWGQGGEVREERANVRHVECLRFASRSRAKAARAAVALAGRVGVACGC